MFLEKKFFSKKYFDLSNWFNKLFLFWKPISLNLFVWTHPSIWWISGSECLFLLSPLLFLASRALTFLVVMKYCCQSCLDKLFIIIILSIVPMIFISYHILIFSEKQSSNYPDLSCAIIKCTGWHASKRWYGWFQLLNHCCFLKIKEITDKLRQIQPSKTTISSYV